jgi:SAM-dependent methyltransferase
LVTVDFAELGIGPGDRVLDVGCGSGRHVGAARQLGCTVIGLDRDLKSLVECNERVAGFVGASAMVLGDALELPFAANTFDAVIVSEVLEHIPDDAAAMREVFRVAKPGSIIGVSVPRWFPEQLCWTLSDDYSSNPGGHVRIYTRTRLTRVLAGAGFTVTYRHHAHALHSVYWWLRCAFGVNHDDAWVPRLYHRALVWQIMRRPRWLDNLERALNPWLGKSLVIYARKPATVEAEQADAA